MSLIQDALKRKSEETTGSHPPGIPVEILEPPTDEKRIRSPFIILIILLITGLIAVFAGLGIYLIKPPAARPIIQTPAPVAEPVVPAAVPEPVAIQEPPVPAVKTTLAETGVVENVVEPVKKEEPAPVIQIEWPELRLTGIAQSDNQSIAVINGKMLSAGRTLGKVIVREVHSTDVVVEYLGERRVLYIDE